MIRNMISVAPKSKTSPQRKPKNLVKSTGAAGGEAKAHLKDEPPTLMKVKDIQEILAMSKQVQEIWDLIKAKLNNNDMNQVSASVNITELLRKLKQIKDKKSTKEMSVMEIKELRKLVCALRENVKHSAGMTTITSPTIDVKKTKKKKPEVKEILKPKKSNLKKIPQEQNKSKQANKKEINQVKKSFNETIEKLAGVKFYSVQTDDDEKLLKAKLRKMKNDEKMTVKKTKKA